MCAGGCSVDSDNRGREGVWTQKVMRHGGGIRVTATASLTCSWDNALLSTEGPEASGQPHWGCVTVP